MKSISESYQYIVLYLLIFDNYWYLERLVGGLGLHAAVRATSKTTNLQRRKKDAILRRNGSSVVVCVAFCRRDRDTRLVFHGEKEERLNH